MRIRSTAALAAAFLCGPVFAGTAPLEIVEPWVRAMPPGQSMTAAYLVVRNTGDVPQSIVGASTAVASSVELHRTQETNGMMGMVRLDRVEVPAGGEVVFAPGGTHLMLHGLADMPEPGESVRLCLQVAGGDEACADALVRRSGMVHGVHVHGDN